MKSEAEIRKYLQDLRRIRHAPCSRTAKGGTHAAECFVGGQMIDANIELLFWVLDENPGMDRFAEELSARARGS